ncbi:MAG: lysoplasmalogenase [Flavobacteriaceae bacterium]
MKEKQQRLQWLFFSAALLNIGAQIAEETTVAAVSKAFIVPSLVWLVCLEKKPSKPYLIALFFSWLGDVFLIFNAPHYFMAGIGSFWITQLLYCWLILERLDGNLLQQITKKRAIAPLASIVAYLTIIFYLILPQLGYLQLPVGLYAFTLATTGFLGLLCAIEDSTKTKTQLAIGCLLFVVSDTMIAFDAFYFSEKLFTFWVMATYIPAQYLISKELAKR